jgi:hypothetical protein
MASQSVVIWTYREQGNAKIAQLDC